jgi:phosphatidylglycerophosphatase A
LKPAGGDRLKTACITVLGSGYGPVAPGSWGSLVAVAIFAGLWWLARALAAPAWTVDIVVALAGILLASWLSVRWGSWAIARFGCNDPPQFVLDEFAGQWVALLWLPPLAGSGPREFAWVIAGQFVLFRILDVIKPPPARQMERLPTGWGVLCDDLMSGLYANVIGQLFWRFSPLAAWLGLAGANA